jgi:hypothetical protein
LQLDRGVAQAASRRPLTSEARVCSRATPCGVCGGQSGTGTDFSPSSSVFPYQHNSTMPVRAVVSPHRHEQLKALQLKLFSKQTDIYYCFHCITLQYVTSSVGCCPYFSSISWHPLIVETEKFCELRSELRWLIALECQGAMKVVQVFRRLVWTNFLTLMNSRTERKLPFYLK